VGDIVLAIIQFGFWLFVIQMVIGAIVSILGALSGKSIIARKDSEIKILRVERDLARAQLEVLQRALARKEHSSVTSKPAPLIGWRMAFGIEKNRKPSFEELNAVFKAKAMYAHPDREGGATERMKALNVAFAEAKAELGYK
jgi:hypothetical protein